MALLRGSLALVSFLVFFISCVEGTYQPVCYRVFPLQLTANAMPCRYICGYYIGHTPHYRVRGEDDGTFCREGGREGVCWSGMCLTRYGQDDDLSQHVDTASKVPLRIRKRDVVSTVKGVTHTKTSESGNGSSFTKSVKAVSATKTTASSEDSDSASATGFKGSYTTNFSADQTRQSTKTSFPQEPSPEFDPFSVKGSPSTSQTTPTVKNGGVTVTVRHGPKGQKITTKTVRRLIITQGPRKTVRRIIFRQGSFGSGSNLMLGGRNTVRSKTITVRRGSMGGASGLMAGGNADMSRKTSQITLHATTDVQRNPIASIVRKTVQQQRVLGGHNAGGASRATKTVSTVALTKAVRPPLSVNKVTTPNVTPSTAAGMGTSNTATVRGLEVEVPGYTAGLRNQWKWVLARRVGVYPPYVQVLDPEVLYYKLGLRNPHLPSLPGPVQNVLNRVPVHPVGSDIYGFLLSSRILERIRGFTERLNGLAKLGSMLSTSNTSNQGNSNVLNSLLTGTESSPSGSTLLQKLLIASLSGLGNNYLNSPYAGYLGSSNGGVFGRPYGGSPWTTFLGGESPAGQWPFYSGLSSQIGRFGRNPSLYPSGILRSSTGEQSLFPEDEKLTPSVETPAPESPESLLGGSSDMKALLESIITRSRHVQPSDESSLSESEKLARALGEEKLRYLLKPRNGRISLIRRMNEALRNRNYLKVLILLKKLGVRPNSRVYNKIVLEILLNRKHRNLGLNQPQDVISMLLERSRKNNDDTVRYFPTLSSTLPRSLEPPESRPNGHRDSTDEVIELLENLRRPQSTPKYSPLADILLKQQHSHHPSRSRDAYGSPKTGVIESLLELSKREPSNGRTSELSKQLTKALLSSGQGPILAHGTKPQHISKLASVQSAAHTEAMPQGLRQSNVFSTAYQTSRGAALAPMPILSRPAFPLEATRLLTQQSQPTAMLGMNGFSSATSGQSFPEPYSQFVPPTYFPNGGSGVSDQSTLLNQQYVIPTGNVYGNTQSQSATTMMSGTRGYSGYSTVPTSTAYMSQYATQPYYLGTSLYGGHPHYVVEGHEAPGTRWQLRVWRHHPGVSYVAPGFGGFQSSHLGSVVARARETVNSGLQLGSQPGHFGFTTIGSGLPGGTISAASSQYVVKAPDGSVVLNRQPLYGSVAQSAPTSSAVASQTKTTKTISGTTGPTVGSGLSGSSFQSIVEGAGSTGTTKSESLSEITQTKQSSRLLNSLDSNSDSQNKESLFGSDSAISSSARSDSTLSQSKLRR